MAVEQPPREIDGGRLVALELDKVEMNEAQPGRESNHPSDGQEFPRAEHAAFLFACLRATRGDLLGHVIKASNDDPPRSRRWGDSPTTREQLHLVVEGAVEPVGQVVGAGGSDEAGEVVNGVGGDGEACEHHAASLRA